MVQMAREYFHILTNAHRNVRWFFLAAFLSQISGGFFGILYNLYIKTLGLPDTVAGSYVSASSIAGALCLVPAGIISDRFGRKRVILIGGGLAGLTSLLQAFMQSPLLIVVGAFCAGMFGSVIWVSILPLLAENTRKEERLHLFSINFGVGLVAQVLGSFMAGTLSQALGKAGLSPVASVRWTLVLGASLGLLALLPMLQITESPRRERVRPDKQRLRQLLYNVRDQREQLVLIAKFTVASAFIGFGAGLVIPYLNLYFAERFHMTKASIGFVIGLAQAVTALAMFIGPAVARRIGPVKAVVTFQLTSIPFLLVTAWASNAVWASGAVIVRNALMNSGGPIQDSVMMALVSEKLRGFSVSAGQTVFTLGWAVMGPVSTNIVRSFGSYTGYAMVFTGTAVLYLVGSVYYGWMFGRHEKAVYDHNNQPQSTIGG